MSLVRGVNVHEICGREEETKRNEKLYLGFPSSTESHTRCAQQPLTSPSGDMVSGDLSHLLRPATRAVEDEIPSRLDFLRGVLQLR